MPPKKPVAAAAAPPKVDEQQLSMKDQTLFKQVLRFYETKQYKKALKSADSILKSKPTHGETLAMKGLIFNNMSKKEEAHQLVKKGLAMNIKSHVCWHVYGLLYRSEYKYDDAIKCYQNALKRDTDNLQILKDLSNLQIQRRMLSGFVESRRRILSLKSNNKQNWLAYAIGNHLTGAHNKALQILDALNNTTGLGEREQNDLRPPTFEESEMHLYRAMILEEAGKYEDTIAYLNSKQDEIVDKLFVTEKIAQCKLKLKQNAEAESLYRKLLAINPDNYAFHLGLQKALGLIDEAATSFSHITYSTEQADKLLSLYQQDSQFQSDVSLAKAAATKRLPLNFTSGATFCTLLKSYLKNKISRGIPSLFSDLEPLYSDNAKVTIIQQTIEGFINNLRKENKFEAEDEKDSESPASFMYALYFAAQHYDFINQPHRALELVRESLSHTVTPPDTYMLAARIYKHAGDPVTAYAYMDQARQLDTQDRYLNTKCVRYALRADQQKAADDTIQLFLRDGDGMKALDELQVMWYSNTAAEMYIRTKQWGRALKRLTFIDKHFNDFYEDQFDFHTYCLRKTTLRAYIDMVRWADSVRGHRYHVRAAFNAVKVYMKLHELPLEEALEQENAQANMTEEEKKNEAKRLKKIEAKKKADAEKKAAEQSQGKAGKDKDADPDPEGLELLKCADPLAEATKFIQYLAASYSNNLQTHTLAVQLYTRREKYLLALRHAKKAIAIDTASGSSALSPDTHAAIMTFLSAVRAEGVMDKLNPIVREVITEQIAANKAFGAGASVEDINNAYLAANTLSLPHRLSVARVMVVLDSNPRSPSQRTKDAVVSLLLPSSPDQFDRATRSQATDVLTFLEDRIKAPVDTLAAFKRWSLNRFPLALAFGAVPNPPEPMEGK